MAKGFSGAIKGRSSGGSSPSGNVAGFRGKGGKALPIKGPASPGQPPSMQKALARKGRSSKGI